MKKVVYILIFINTLLMAEIQIATAKSSGLYFPIGKDIANVCGLEVGGLEVIPTEGSLDNLQKIATASQVKFAIVQYDALLYAINNTTYSSEAKKAIKNLRIVAPLYSESIHLITKKSLHIASLDDLENLRVAVGEKKSGSYISALNVVRYTNAKWLKTYTTDINKSLDNIINGTLDAVIYVSGVPSKILYTGAGTEKEQLFKQNFDMYSIAKNGVLKSIYAFESLTKDDYSWLEHSVSTFATRAVLIANNYEPYQDNYKKVKKIYECIYQHENILKTENYSSKWQEIDITDFKGINWQIHPAVHEFLNTLKNAHKDKVTKGNRQRNEIDWFLYIIIGIVVIIVTILFIKRKRKDIIHEEPTIMINNHGISLMPVNEMQPVMNAKKNETLLVGRSDKCNIKIKEQVVSNQHIKITFKKDTVEVTDLQSTNGTYIDHEKLVPNKTYILEEGQQLIIGGEAVVYSINGSTKKKTPQTLETIVLKSKNSTYADITQEGILGRSQDCDIVIENKNVSRKHLKISLSNKDIYITDLGSANGTYIDGKKLEINIPTLLLPGKQLIIGSEEVIYVH